MDRSLRLPDNTRNNLTREQRAPVKLSNIQATSH